MSRVGQPVATCVLVETPSEFTKFDFCDNFVSKNSAQMHNFTTWYSRGDNLQLVDLSASWQKHNSERFLEKDIRHHFQGWQILLI